MNNMVLISIRSIYADKIFGGLKTVELRRVRPQRVQKGTLALVYVPAPLKALVGAFRVSRVIERPPDMLWEMVKREAGVTREEYTVYYAGADLGVAIFLDEVWTLPQPVDLRDLRTYITGFQPPQSFRYVKESDMAAPQLARLVEESELAVQGSFLTDASES